MDQSTKKGTPHVRVPEARARRSHQGIRMCRMKGTRRSFLRMINLRIVTGVTFRNLAASSSVATVSLCFVAVVSMATRSPKDRGHEGNIANCGRISPAPAIPTTARFRAEFSPITGFSPVGSGAAGEHRASSNPVPSVLPKLGRTLLAAWFASLF